MGKEEKNLLSIFSIQFPQEIPQNININEIKLFAGSFKFPSKEQIALMKKPIKYTELLSTINYYFPLSPDILSLILNENPESHEVQIYLSCFVFCSYITWRIYAEMTDNFDQFELILQVLEHIVSFPTFCDISIKLIVETILFYISKNKDISLDFIISSIEELLTLEEETALHAVMIEIVNKLIRYLLFFIYGTLLNYLCLT